MVGDPLYEPLGTKIRQHRSRSGVSPMVVGAAMIVVVAVIAAGAVMLNPGRADRDSVAVAPIEPAPKVAAVQPVTPPTSQAAVVSANPNVAVEADGDTVEIQHGVKIIRMGAAHVKAVAAIPSFAQVPEPLQPAPNPLLVEKSRFGDLPRIGPDGTRPSEAYARPPAFASPDLANAPRIAILIGGLGPDAAASERIARQLPAAVSLAFRPEGPDLATQVSQARDAGHEVLLEFPAVSTQNHGEAGPRPLGEQAGATGTVDDLHRSMGRFTGYVGATAQIGSKLLADPKTARIALQDMSSRGLLFVDNSVGAVGRPVDPPGLRSAYPDVVVDGRLAPASVQAALDQLESVARSKGRALAVVGGLSDSLPAMAAFVGGLQMRGIALVPVSALAQPVSASADVKPAP